MAVALVLTILGPDRAGLVEELAALITSCEGNWLDSRMSHLGGQFAGILRITVGPERQDELEAGFVQLRKAGLQIAVQPDEAETAPVERKTFKIELKGQDHPGIVRELTHVLAQHEGNIEELSTWTESAPWSGDTLFCAHVEVRAPSELLSAELREALEGIAFDLMVDIKVGPAMPTVV